MNDINEPNYLEDLKQFRWELYHHKKSREVIKCLCRFYLKKYYFEHFAEEIIIAGYDLQNLDWDTRMEVHLHVPHLLMKEMPSLRKREAHLWDLNRLFICLVYDNLEAFIEGLQLIADQIPNDLCKVFVCCGFLIWQLETWLKPSVKQTLYQAIETLQTLHHVITPQLANIFKNYRSRIDHGKGKRYTSVIEVIDATMRVPKFRHKKEIEHFSREECLEIFIDFDLSITKQLHNNHTALYHAMNRNNLNAICKLLHRGSFIGIEIDSRDYNICNVDSMVLEKHFDSCISKCVDNDQFIEIDLKNFIAPRRECRICDGNCTDEMKVIELLADSHDHQQLLAHPLISMFVHLKWNRFALICYIDFILYVFFALSTVGYILAIEEHVSHYIKLPFAIMMVVLIIYVAARRLLHQMFEQRQTRPWNRFISYLKCVNTMAILMLIIFLLLNVNKRIRLTLATICILLIAVELFILAGSIFWSFSKYYIIFKNITLGSLKSLQLCLILLPAFSLSFYLMWRNPRTNPNFVVNDDYDLYQPTYQHRSTPYQISNSFDHIRTSFLKTIAMSSDELDIISSNFDFNIFSSILFLGFLFVISTVFMNLMTGIAVNETKHIESDVISLIQRVKMLALFEGTKSFEKHWLRRKFPDTWIMRIIERFSKLNSLEMLSQPSNTKVYIGPQNKVLILRKDYKTAEQYSTIFDENGSYLNSWISYFCISNRPFHVDPNIVRAARRILEQNYSNRVNVIEKSSFQHCIAQMENDLKQMNEIVKRHETVVLKKFKDIINAMQKRRF